MSDPCAEEIVKGWADLVKDFKHRPLNAIERLQLERALANEAITQKYGVSFQGLIK